MRRGAEGEAGDDKSAGPVVRYCSEYTSHNILFVPWDACHIGFNFLSYKGTGHTEYPHYFTGILHFSYIQLQSIGILIIQLSPFNPRVTQPSSERAYFLPQLHWPAAQPQASPHLQLSLPQWELTKV